MSSHLRLLFGFVILTAAFASCRTGTPNKKIILSSEENLNAIIREYDSSVFEPVSKKLANGENLSPEEIDQFAKAPETRADFYTMLWEYHKQDIFPNKYYNFGMASESRLVEWLMYPTELDTVPSKIELVKTVNLLENDSTFIYYVYKFKTDKPHWAAKDGWMLGVVGPYFKDSEPYEWPKGIFSRFKKISESTPEDEVDWTHRNIFRTNNKK